jgi:oligopeptide/dipeptide ABC transporter ATP-binding protein
MSLLEVENLSISYRNASGQVRVVRDCSFSVGAGESLGLVGETGSGKSTVALALAGLLDGNARIESGAIRFAGKTLASVGSRDWNRLRGSRIGIVFQDARGALNPVLTVGAQLTGALRAHQRLSGKSARERALELLADAGIPDPPFYMRRYPLELSGGLCQRVAIAIAICNRPVFLIADEPTSALDPSIQAQILELLRDLKDRHALAMLLISHDLALVSEVSEWIAVMYHGRLVEFGKARDVFGHPAHPYTAALLECQADMNHRWDRQPLAAIGGSPPVCGHDFQGCPFAPRCSRANAECSRSLPFSKTVGDRHWASCFKAAEGDRPSQG